MNLYDRLTDFINSLAKYPPKDHPASQVADMHARLLTVVNSVRPTGQLSARARGHSGPANEIAPSMFWTRSNAPSANRAS